MKYFYFKSKLFVFAILIGLYSSGKSQEGRLPTAKELEIKENLRKQYAANAGRNSNQNHLMVTGPTQDCAGAQAVCSESYTQSVSYTGYGSVQEVYNTCLQDQETNSTWYVFTAQNSGTFAFTLNTTDDYDFALYDITSIGCAGVPSATPIRCNYSGTYGNTGLTLPPQAGNLSYNAAQSPTMPGINVTAGQVYALIVDNFSGNTNGYILNFGGTASIFNTTPPTITGITNGCNSNTIAMNFSELVQCNSILSNGSQFTITGPSGAVPVTGITGNVCSAGANTNGAVLTFNSTGLTTGVYTLSTSGGIKDYCGNVMVPQSLTFQYLGPVSIAATNTAVCAGTPVTFTLSGDNGAAGAVFSWSPVSASTNTLTVNPTTSNTYIGTITYGGCSSSASQAITITAAPVVSVNPANASLCSGTTNVTAISSMGGSACSTCSYTWTGGVSQVNNNVASSTISGVGAGTYSVTVSSGGGGTCVGNTAVSTISILTPTSVPTCDVIYVTPSGGGTGLLPTSPTDIVTALTMAACNSITIKMQVGKYAINAPLNVGSYVTIEGGYNSTFTLKTSSKATPVDITGAAFPNEGTQIERTTTSPEGSAGNQRLTAFNVTSGSSYFWFQDLMILVDNPASNSYTSNYGIYLGSGCSNYNIVRCLINAGTGSAGVNGTPGGNGGSGTTDLISSNGGTSAVAGQVGGSGGLGGGINSPYSGEVLLSTTGGGNDSYVDINGNGAYDAGTDVLMDVNGYYYIDMNNNGTYDAGIDVLNSNGQGGGENGFGPGVGVNWDNSAIYGALTINGGGSGGQDVNVHCNNASTAGVGANGANGSNGSNGTAASYGGGFFVIGGNGTNGTGGAGGGGGGYNAHYGYAGAGGGGGGGAGQAGTAAGGAFGIFSVVTGASSNIIDCNITATAGTAGTGGSGGASGAGGTDVSINDTDAGACATNAGGAGGKGGNGGNGAAGASCLVCDLNGTTLNTLSPVTNYSLTTQTVITVTNLSCDSVPLNHTNTAGGASSWTFGTGSNPTTGATTPAATTYTSLGRHTVTLNANTYTDFNNTIVNPPSRGSILASATAICPGAATFASSVAGTAGLGYSWSVSPAATIGSATTATTSITFANAGTTPITYTVTLTINSQCCGNLLPLTTTITVNPIPANPTVSANTPCIGGVGSFTATAPAGDVFNWYNAASSGTLLATGTTYSASPISGPYTVYIQASNSGGCTSSTISVVITPTAVPAPTAISNTACDTGYVSVGINPAAGVTNYNWYSNPAPSGLVQSGTALGYSQLITTAGGSYTVYVQSIEAGCTASALVPVVGSVITNTISITSTVTPNDTICVNSTFTLSITASGGSGAYTYAWTPAGGTSNTITQTLTASTLYNVTVNSAGCSKSFNFPITVAPYPKDTIVAPGTLSCSGGGAILDGSHSGAGVYNWTTTGGNFTSPVNTNTVSINAGGVYVLSITDPATTCVSRDTVTITAAALPKALINVPPAATCAPQTVTLNDSTSSAGLGVTYSWTTSNGTIVSGSNAASAVVNASGIYTLTVTDNSCVNTATVSVNFNPSPLPPIFTTPSVTNPVNECQGQTPITLSVTPTGTISSTPVWYLGTTHVASGYTYTPATTTTGTTVYTVIDSANGGTGCKDTSASNVLHVTVTINAIPSAPTYSLPISGNDTVCHGSPATLTVNSGTNTAVWYQGNTYLYAGSTYTPPANLAVGTYTYSVIDSIPIVNGCTSGSPSANTTTLSLTVKPSPIAPVLTAPTGTNNIYCQGSPTPLTVSTGTATPTPVAVWYSNNAVVNIGTSYTPPANLTAGQYTYSVIDSIPAIGGCTNAPQSLNTTTLMVTVNPIPPTPTLSLPTTANDSVCQGVPITLSVNTGTTVPTPVASWYTGNVWLYSGSNYTPAISSLLPGVTYTYSIIDSIPGGGCVNAAPSLNTTTVSLYIKPAPATPTVTGSQTITECQYLTPAQSFTAQPAPGSVAVWYNANGTAVAINTNTYAPSDNVAGNNIMYYLVDSSTTNGCTSAPIGGTIPLSVTINPTPTTPTLTTAADTTLSECQLGTATTLTVIPAVGSTPVWYNTNTGAVVAIGSSFTPPNAVASPPSIIYSVIDSATTLPATWCKSSLIGGNALTITVTVHPAPTINVTNQTNLDSANCGKVGTLTVSPSAITGLGTPPLHYQWYANGTAIPHDTTLVLTTGTTSVTGTTYSLQVTDSLGCHAIAAPGTGTTFTVPSVASPVILFTINPDSAVNHIPYAATFTNQTTTVSGNLTYTWTYGDGQGSNLTSPTHTYTSVGNYTVMLIASNGSCIDTATKTIITEQSTMIIIPNIFSPNGDNINDVFFIINTGMSSLNCTIFNRWGQLLYTITAPNQGWDGKTPNGDNAPDGTYMYILQAQGLNGKTYKQNGTVTLVR